MELALVLCSWTPTIVLLILFKKLLPNSSIKKFYKNAFKERLNWKILVFTTVLQLLIFVVAMRIIAFIKNVSIFSLLDLSFQTIAMGFFWTLTQGAGGEESGWRGFLQPSIEKKHGVVKSSVIVGTIWGFWHMPLWLISGHTGKELIMYSILFLVWIILSAIIIGICYSRCRNLFVPIWIHFMVNFCITVFTGGAAEELYALACFAVLYALAAMGYIVWYKRGTKV